MKNTAAALVGLVLSLSTIHATAADVQISPHLIIGQLNQRIVAIGQSTAKQDDFDIATTTALEDLRTFINSGANPQALTIKDKWGKTPLNMATYMGYDMIVAELLAQPSVKISINEPDDQGITPWTYSVFAARQSAFACNPKLFVSPFSWSPLHLSQPYYTARNPYVKVRALLEEAGAVSDMAQAKQQWNTICKFQSNAMKNAVTASDDLQHTAIAEGAKALDTFITKLQGR